MNENRVVPWWLRLGYYIIPHWRGLLLVVLLMLMGVGLEVLQPWPLKLIVDYVLTRQSLPNQLNWLAVVPGSTSSVTLLTWLVASTLLLFAANRVVGVAQRYIQSGTSNRMKYELGSEILDYLQRLSLRFHGRQRTGDMVRRVTKDSECVQRLVLGVFLPLITSVVRLVAMFAVMWRLEPTLSILAILVALPLGLMIRLFIRPITERSYEQYQLEGEMMAVAEQTLTALPIVQAYGREAHEDRRFRDLSQQTVTAYLRVWSSQTWFSTGTGAITAIGTAGIMVGSGIKVLDGSLSLGDLLIFLAYLASLYSPLQTLAYLSSGFGDAAAGARRVMEVLDAEDRVEEAPDAQPLPVRAAGKRGHVQLEGVTFGYEANRPIVQDVTLEVRPGEMVALVGHTGAGKSTLVSLIPRFFDPWQGRVLFDGVDVRQLQLHSLRAQVALVLQDPFLLPLSVAENIAYGRPSASRDEIVAAAVAARADEFIRQLPQGYDSIIGERGATLSGGQKQRLSIARALLKDAPVLILDEPTSALDAETESLLLEALERLMEGRTTFIIAHRLSTIRKADRIVVLDHGKVVEMGTHQDLVAASGSYWKLVSAQVDSAVQSEFSLAMR